MNHLTKLLKCGLGGLEFWVTLKSNWTVLVLKSNGWYRKICLNGSQGAKPCHSQNYVGYFDWKKVKWQVEMFLMECDGDARTNALTIEMGAIANHDGKLGEWVVLEGCGVRQYGVVKCCVCFQYQLTP
jgi:hypothetical protein